MSFINLKKLTIGAERKKNYNFIQNHRYFIVYVLPKNKNSSLVTAY